MWFSFFCVCAGAVVQQGSCLVRSTHRLYLCSLRPLTPSKKNKTTPPKVVLPPQTKCPAEDKKSPNEAQIHSKLLLLLVTCGAIRNGRTARRVIVYPPPNRPRRKGRRQLAALRCVGRVRLVLAVTCPESRQHDRCALVGDGIGGNLFGLALDPCGGLTFAKKKEWGVRRGEGMNICKERFKKQPNHSGLGRAWLEIFWANLPK